MEYFLGIDIGARMSKAVLIEGDRIVAFTMLPSGTNYASTAQRLKLDILEKAKVPSGVPVSTVSTGLGAQSVPFSQHHASELRCCSRGINFIFPAARTVIDIGGSSIRVIRIDGRGHVVNFAISEKCATGSGYFIETIANVLRVDIQDIGSLSLKSKKPVIFTTGCTVFSESEAICMVSEGFSVEDILAGVHKALANKVSSLVHRVGLEEPCAISGGVNPGLIKALEAELAIRLLVPFAPQIITGLGAALLGAALIHVGTEILQ